ncbi:hypothetical protein J6590_011071 [Homalodisca vitripennis]|nr:hypothetical protein J6590_011071 [Homalodisca vitripennis]
MDTMRLYTLLLWLVLLLISVAANSVPVYQRDNGRSTRGFKNQYLSTARSFGKRTDSDLSSSTTSQFSNCDSFPADWLTSVIQNNGRLARLIGNKLTEASQDGEQSVDELLRSPYGPPPTIYK